MKPPRTKYALFFDIDGTLVHHHQITRRTVRALRKAKAAGYTLFINTGRSRGFLPDCLLDKTEWDGYICGGCYAEYRGEVLLDERIERELASKICEYAEKEGLRLILEGTEHCYTLNYTRRDFIFLSSAQEAAARYDEMKLTKVTFADRLTEKQKEYFDNDLHVIQMARYTEAYKKGVDKAYGMNAIAKKLGVSRENTVAFGDSQNDKEMLEAVELRVVMRDAPEEIRALATIQTKSRRSGVAEGLRKLGLYRK